MSEAIDGNVGVWVDLCDQAAIKFGLHAPGHDLPSDFLKVDLTFGILCQPLCEYGAIPQILESVARFQMPANGCFAGADTAGDSDYKPLTPRPPRRSGHERGILPQRPYQVHRRAPWRTVFGQA